MRLHTLTYLDEGDHVVVGRTDTDSYAVFPRDASALLRRIEAGASMVEAADWYLRTYGESVDIAEFERTLREFDFVRAENPSPTAAIIDSDSKPVRWQRLGRALFGGTAWICYAAVVAAAIVVMAARPRLIPHTSNLFFTHYVTLIALTLFLGQFPLLFLHEGFHGLAGRRLGLRTRLRVSNRIYFVVLETRMDGLVVKPRRQRYLPMLAGMLADVLAISVLTLVAAPGLRADGTVAPVAAVCLALAFATSLRLVWQFFFHLRTDLYYVAIVVLGCQDLHAAAKLILANRLRRLFGRPVVDEARLYPRDRAIGRWYSWLLLIGYTFSLSTFAFAAMPALIRSVGITVGRFTQPGLTLPRVLDSVVFLSLTGGQFLFAGYLAARRRWRARAADSPSPQSDRRNAS